MPTTDVGQPRARLVLPGSDATEATVQVIYQPRATRVSRAVIVLGVAVAVMPVAFFIPPRFLWSVVSLAVGVYLARRYWRGEYYVIEFSGRCPRCSTAVELPRGTRLRGRQSVECDGCHRRPELLLNDPDR